MLVNIRKKETEEFEALETLRWKIIDDCNDAWDDIEFYRGKYGHKEDLEKADQNLSKAQERLEEIENKIYNFTGYRSSFNRAVYRGSIQGLHVTFISNRTCGLFEELYRALVYHL